MFRIRTARIAIVKKLCELAAHHSTTDLNRNGIVVQGHCFIKTRFALQNDGGVTPLYFCRCGEMALQHDDLDGTLACVADDGCTCKPGHCPRAEVSQKHTNSKQKGAAE